MTVFQPHFLLFFHTVCEWQPCHEVKWFSGEGKKGAEKRCLMRANEQGERDGLRSPDVEWRGGDGKKNP